MRKTCISKGWYLTAPGTDGFVQVDLPNDYTIGLPRSADVSGGASNGFFPGGDGRYVQYLRPDGNAQHVILDLDGAYMCAEIYLNGDLLAMHPHGYTPFLQELTDRLRPGRTNKLEITTHGLQRSTRWYSGAGLYRDAFLWTGGAVRVEPWDVFVTTPRADTSGALARVEYRVASDLDCEASVEARIVSPAGETVARAQAAFAARKGEKTPVALEMTID